MRLISVLRNEELLKPDMIDNLSLINTCLKKEKITKIILLFMPVLCWKTT